MYFFRSHFTYPTLSEEELTKKLLAIYKLLNKKLAAWDDGNILTVWSPEFADLPPEQFGLADAYLYAHIARAFSNPSLAPMIQEYGHIIHYFEKMNTRCFIDFEVNDLVATSYFQVSDRCFFFHFKFHFLQPIF
jgi:hypothetical protein